MKFLVTMNMPSRDGNEVHQMTLEYPCESVEELCVALNQKEFLTFRQLYRQKDNYGETVWIDRGLLIVNSYHIGKAQEFVEYEKGDTSESVAHVEYGRSHFSGARGPIRPHRRNV